MCLAVMTKNLETENEPMTKSIKISDTAHKALEIAKAFEGIKIGEYSSAVILEAIQKEHPEVYKQLRDQITKKK